MSKSLCSHVDLEIDRESSPPSVTVVRGSVYPYFSWSGELGADIPRLKCSHCGRAVKILGHVVRRDRPFLGDK